MNIIYKGHQMTLARYLFSILLISVSPVIMVALAILLVSFLGN